MAILIHLCMPQKPGTDATVAPPYIRYFKATVLDITEIINTFDVRWDDSTYSIRC